MLTTLVVLALVVGWGTYFFFWWRDGRTTAAPARRDGMTGFNQTLGSLGGSAARAQRVALSPAAPSQSPIELGMPQSPSEAAHRRSQVALLIGGAALITLLGAVAFTPLLFVPHVLFDVALLAYGYAVAQRNSVSAEREMKVHLLHPVPPPAPEQSRRPELVGAPRGAEQARRPELVGAHRSAV